MDVVGKIVQGTGCAVDGTVAAQNPLSRALDRVVQSHVRGGQIRETMQHYDTRSELQMQMQRPSVARRADPPFLLAFELEAANRSRMEAAFISSEVQQPMVPTHQVAMEEAFQEAQRTHFQHKLGPSQPIMESQMMHSRAMQYKTWVQGFHSKQLDAAWQTVGKSSRDVAWDQANAPMHVLQQPSVRIEAPSAQQANITPKQMTQEVVKNLEAQQASSDMARIMSQNSDPRFQNSQFFKFINQVSTGEVRIDEEKNVVVSGETEKALEGVWSNTDIHSNRDLFDASSKQSDSASVMVMDNAFAEAADAHAQTLDTKFGISGSALAAGPMSVEEKILESAWGESGNLAAIWEKAAAEFQTTDTFEDAWDSAANQSYIYKAENPFLDLSESFQKGIEFFKSGYLDDAIFAFEAEVQQHPENSEAWRMLGECHAENDEDKTAILCLERAVKEDPYNLSALLALGVSNVNELNSQGALKTLKAWVQHNSKFHGLEIQVDEYSDGSLMDEVMQLMLQARAHDQNDSDVQVVLGVLYNVSKDYDAAVESFKSATISRPDEYALWNKIGATLANSARSAEAIPAYHRALELKPRYARGWLNLGISHANLGNYEEATKCYLQALSLNTRADHIWSYLRICFTCMERFDLVTIADSKDFNHFRQEFKLIDL